jgi:accessory colonization factor AcfC
LDEKSGALSEQKIKTLNLEKSLENCRKGYDENIKNVMDSSTKFQEVLIKKLEESYKLLTGSFE